VRKLKSSIIFSRLGSVFQWQLRGRRTFKLIGIGLLASSQSLFAESVTLQWTAAASDTRVTGYEIHYGTASSLYPSMVVANANGANTNTQAIDGLKAGLKYYFAVRSRGATTSDVSAFSNEVNTTIAAADATNPTVPVNLSASAINTSQINLTWTASTDNIGVSGYQIERCQVAGCSSFALVAIANSTSYTDLGLSPATNYSYRIRAIDLSGLKSSYSTIINATTLAANSTQSCSGNTIWPSTVKPSIVANPDAASIELGVKFKSDKNGYICGVRFYKSNTNTGTHVGRLWNISGTLLAQATFTNETSSGWQQVNFSKPVAITAGTVYVASYLAPKGHYSSNVNEFSTTGVDKAPLHALKNGISGGNGVYLYGSGGFPKYSYQSCNYWVDVVFSNTDLAATSKTAMSSVSMTAVVNKINYKPVLGAANSITIESGELNIDDQWSWVNFRQTFTDPVVVANVPTDTNLEKGLVRIDGVDSKGFWIHREGEINGFNKKETVGYIAIERGRYQLENGAWLEAEHLQTSKINGFEQVNFEEPFIDVPVIFTSISTVNSQDKLTTRVRNISVDGFEVGLHAKNIGRQSRTDETIDYIAWETSSGEINGVHFDVSNIEQNTNEDMYTVIYPLGFDYTPIILAEIQSKNGEESTSIQLDNKDIDTLDLRIEVEKSPHQKTSSTSQNIGYLLMEMTK
jgi:hypothetical protein